jgi:hypothetical protein
VALIGRSTDVEISNVGVHRLYDRPAMTNPADQTAIRAVGAALVLRHAAIAQAMTERIATDVPAYRRAEAGLLEDVLVLATPTARVLAQSFAAGTPLRREDVGVLREQAARRVHQGVGLEAFLHAYRVALSVYWDACAEEAARQGLTRDATFVLARFALEAMDTMTSHAAEAYLREETRVRTRAGRELRDLVEHLILGQGIDLAHRHRAAPGLDPTEALLTVVGRVDRTALPAGDALQVARDALSATLALGRVRPLVAIRQDEVVLIAAVRSAPDRRTHLEAAREHALDGHGVDVRFGLSAASPGFAGVRHAYREATLALSYTSAARPIVSLAELPALDCALLGADAATRDLIAARGTALDPALAETVHAFAAADLNIARTAGALAIHPNSVRHRLRRIAGATGHDPRTFAGLVELTCVLEVRGDGARPVADRVFPTPLAAGTIAP